MPELTLQFQLCYCKIHQKKIRSGKKTREAQTFSQREQQCCKIHFLLQSAQTGATPLAYRYSVIVLELIIKLLMSKTYAAPSGLSSLLWLSLLSG